MCLNVILSASRFPLSLNMPAAVVHLIFLVFAVALCTASSTTGQHNVMETTTKAAVQTEGNSQPSTATHQITSTTPATMVSLASQTPPVGSTPAQTHTLLQETSPSLSPQTTKANTMSTNMVSSGPSGHSTPETPRVSRNTAVTATSAGFSNESGKSDLAANPGLVAVICIFCIIFVLVLVVALIKCTKSPRSKFERLDDVPMGNVSEDSPFAQYSK